MLESSLIGKEVYLRVMGTAMKDLIERHKKELEQYSDLDLEAIKKVTYLYEFDRAVQ